MALKISTTEQLRTYMSKVGLRANHHATNVKYVYYTLAGFIIERSTDIHVHYIDGDTKNVLWCIINDTRYCFTYEHISSTSGFIHCRKNNWNNENMKSFTDKTPIEEIAEFFNSLS